MEPNKTLLKIIKSEPEKLKIIMDNILIMLGNRIYIDKAKVKQRLLDPADAQRHIIDKGDNVFLIKTANNETYVVKIIFQKITAIGKQSLISEFFKEYAESKKIIVAQDFNNKISTHVAKHRTQIFREAVLLTDIISHVNQPRYELLTHDEMRQIKLDYNINDYTTKKLLRHNTVAKYYDLKRGELVRVIRPSPTSGNAIDYLIVM